MWTPQTTGIVRRSNATWRELAARVPADGRVVLLGSVATGKYVDLLAAALGARLHYPPTFIGRGDMSRGGLLLRSAAARRRVGVRGARRRRATAWSAAREARAAAHAAKSSSGPHRPRLRRSSRNARAKSAGRWCALSPLGFGSTQSRAPSNVSGCGPRTRGGAIEGRPIGHHAHDGDDPRPEASHLARETLSAGAKFGGGELVGRRRRARDEIRDPAPEGQELRGPRWRQEARGQARGEKRRPEAVPRPREVMTRRARIQARVDPAEEHVQARARSRPGWSGDERPRGPRDWVSADRRKSLGKSSSLSIF